MLNKTPTLPYHLIPCKTWPKLTFPILNSTAFQQQTRLWSHHIPLVKNVFSSSLPVQIPLTLQVWPNAMLFAPASEHSSYSCVRISFSMTVTYSYCYLTSERLESVFLRLQHPVQHLAGRKSSVHYFGWMNGWRLGGTVKRPMYQKKIAIIIDTTLNLWLLGQDLSNTTMMSEVAV